jgi:hypothetical protein
MEAIKSTLRHPKLSLIFFNIIFNAKLRVNLEFYKRYIYFFNKEFYKSLRGAIKVISSILMLEGLN